MKSLITEDKVVGIFKGFSDGGLEFHADIVLKYHNDFQNIPMHGQFLLVALEGNDEAVLGRITSVNALGKLAGTAGEDYAIHAITEGRNVAENLREGYLKYKVDIRVLGVIRLSSEKILFAPSHRRLPHVGSKVAFLSDELLQEVAGHNLVYEDQTPAAAFGYLSYGEFIYNGGKPDSAVTIHPWMQEKSPEVVTRFKIDHLVSRRSFVFARAGFGKSNLVKLLFSNLYKVPPTIKKGGTDKPVGTIIFDPDGEYFWPDDNGRPGLCDVPELKDNIVVFTNRESKSEYYQSFVVGKVKLDIRRLKPADVISIALPVEKQNQQNILKLKGLPSTKWIKLVDLVNKHGNSTPLEDIRELILGERQNDRQDAEILAIRSNINTIIRTIHDSSSQTLDQVFESLSDGKLCIFDVSQMRGSNSLILSGLILQRIFEHNQTEFTKAESKGIPTIAVVEEAQSVLGHAGGNEGPYISWVKEGRKFGLGALLITQQPGSIPTEILSQGDNWFVFHLLSAADLAAVKHANAHFSNDLLSSLLNEPIPGNGLFWSSTGGTPYPISMRVISFEKLYNVIDPDYTLQSDPHYSSRLRDKYMNQIKKAEENLGQIIIEEVEKDGFTTQIDEQPNALEIYLQNAFKKVRENQNIMEKLMHNEAYWMLIQAEIEKSLPASLVDRSDIAYQNVPVFLNSVLGEGKWGTERRPKKTSKGETTYIIKKE